MLNEKQMDNLRNSRKLADLVLEKAKYCLDEIAYEHARGETWVDVDDLNAWGMGLLKKMGVVTVIHIDGKNRAQIKGLL